MKGVQIGKEGLKVALLAGGVILFSGDPKDFTRKLLELIILSAKWQIAKSMACPYTKDKPTKRATREVILSIINTKQKTYTTKTIQHRR